MELLFSKLKHISIIVILCVAISLFGCNRNGCPAFEKGSYDRGVPELKEKRKFKADNGLGFDRKKSGSRKKSLSKQKKNKKKKKFD